MPRSGSQITICDLPIRFDTYKGCTHNCAYCFTYRKYDISNIEAGEGVESLSRFIKGERTLETNWCDWDIPIHWGGMSDPLQPVEKKQKRSLECLKLLQKTGYPFIMSTKSDMIADDEYKSLIMASNCAIQVSAICDKFDKVELGAPSFKERTEAIEKIAKKKRVIIRIQPYMTNVFKDVMATLETYAKINVFGVVIEGLKYFSKKPGFVKSGGDYVYPTAILSDQMMAIRHKAHNLGLRFYSGKNRLRQMGDDLCCCGVDGLGWMINKSNLNHYVVDGNIEYTPIMDKPNTGGVFKSGFFQESVRGREVGKMSYKEVMELMKKDKKYLDQLK